MPSSTISSSKNYRLEIDGLRALAVIAVILNHFNKKLLPSGFLGVDIFFVISGYVITSSLAGRDYEQVGDFLLGFYSRRIKRLMPGLVTCIAITALVGFLFIPPGSEDFAIAWKTGATALFGLSNLYLFTESTDYFAASTELNLFTQTWSLGVEEQFYLIFPLILWLTGFVRNRPNGKRNLFLSMLLLSSLSLCSYLLLININQPATYFLMPCRFWELGLGCITFLAYQSEKPLPTILKFASPLFITGLLVGTLCIPQVSTNILTVVAVVLTALLIGTINANSSVYRALTWKPVLFIGRISYSLYLWHWSVLAISRWTIGVGYLTFPIQLGLIFLLGFISYTYVEQPLRFGEWSKSRVKTIGYGLGTALVCSGLLFGLGNPLKGLLYIGKESKLIKKGVSTLGDNNYWNGRLAWSGEKCVLGSNEEVGKVVRPEFCTFSLLENKGTHFLVIGDSYSAAEIEMTKVLAQKGLGRVTVTSSWGASPIKEIPNNSGWSKTNDYYWNSVVPDLISHLRAGDIIIMVNEIDNFAPPTYTEQSKERLKILHDGLNSLVKQLEKKSIGVIFQSANPFIRESGCAPDVAITDIGVRQWLPFKGIGACKYLTKADSLKRRAMVHDALIDLEKSNQNFKVLDLFNVLCPDIECSYLGRGNKLMYRDVYSHLSVEGSIESQPQLLKTVEALKLRMGTHSGLSE
jgi:peptidoglycan/LPS O-acetylase OafA/YrhL